ncbi:ElyC/SanA/YdcF family protein [Bosea vestrisii]|uniref:ElyC/SanA/YdcF family protein n=1 Tax=Bosea vestrisii TaxID=151416 RepID=UPI0024DFBB24|nr:ElyC/SanA/YdcF family protein [Bosea vestrisii]WID98769.1 ElyC/SanA/YdcF family protein [Bosea vestrisii]
MAELAGAETQVALKHGRRYWWRAFVSVVAAALAADMVVAFALWCYADARYGRETLPAAAGPAAAVVFYNSTEPFQTQRFERAIALLREGKVDRLLFVGGYRVWRRTIGAETQAQRARALIGRDDVAAADDGSYDTLSNMAAICALRERTAPGRNLIMVSDALHLMRIWGDRDSLACLDGDGLGFAASALYSDAISMWIIANKDMAARLARFALGEERYRDLVQRWRYLPS